MKQIFHFLIGGLLLANTTSTSAQISVDKVEAPTQNVQFKNKLRSTAVDVDYFNRARYRAERAAIRKERNFLELSGGLQGTLTSYNDPWVNVSGGDNAIALVATFGLHHIFKKNNFSIETKFNAKLGYNRMKVESTVTDDAGNTITNREGIWFKNQDEFALWVHPSFKLAKNWTYGATVQFRSQFINGYVSRTEQERKHLKSCFMTPAYFDVSLGVTYKCPKPKWPITINLSPIAMSAVYAQNEWIRRQQFATDGTQIKPAYAYGIENLEKSSRYEGGSSIEINYDRSFGKSSFLRYRTTIHSFYGWITNICQTNKVYTYSDYRHQLDDWTANGNGDITLRPSLPIHPTVRWTNTLDIKATKFLSTTLSFQLYYNRAQNTDVQTRTLLSVGLTYTFRNKPKA